MNSDAIGTCGWPVYIASDIWWVLFLSIVAVIPCIDTVACCSSSFSFFWRPARFCGTRIRPRTSMYQVEVKLTCVRSSQNNNDTSLVCDSIGYLFEIGKNDCEALKKVNRKRHIVASRNSDVAATASRNVAATRNKSLQGPLTHQAMSQSAATLVPRYAVG